MQILQTVSVYVLKKKLCLLHPVAPFITEELWHHFKIKEENDIILSQWPRCNSKKIDNNSEDAMRILQDVITAVRSIRSRMGVPPAKKSDLFIF